MSIRYAYKAIEPRGLLPHLQQWADTHTTAIVLDTNRADSPYGTWDYLVAVGCAQRAEAKSGGAFDILMACFEAQDVPDWWFGYFAYDLKNEIEVLSSSLHDGLDFPDLFFFRPNTVIGCREGQVFIETLDPDPKQVLEQIMRTHLAPSPIHATPIELRPRMSKVDYCQTVAQIRQHIIDGDLYEMNLCQEFFAEQADIDPMQVFTRFNERTRAPFAAFFKHEGRYILSASPERFLKKDGDALLSQPIKGTRRRIQDPAADAAIRAELANSEKDRAENVMIVDLVRNDLAKHCLPGSVEVPELFGIHTFETVHQMISTVTGRLRPSASALEALRGAFPMGSMTGAPKVMAMQLIEQYERSRRGVYSGALGYFDPAGNFDFNVIIRSIVYNRAKRYISCQVGGAIVYDSVVEQEYEECLVKLAALQAALRGE